MKRNTYDEVTIANGSQGMKRIDLVVARYTKNPETEKETMSWTVIQGTPVASNPVAPDYTHGNMQEGDMTDDCPAFEVYIDGIQVTEIKKLLTVLNGNLAELNSKISILNGATGTVGAALRFLESTDTNLVYGYWNEGLYMYAANIDGHQWSVIPGYYWSLRQHLDHTASLRFRSTVISICCASLRVVR